MDGLKTINIAEAKAHLSELIARAEAGEDILIARAGKPVARLSALSKAERKPGLARHWPRLAPEDFAPMAQEELDALEADWPSAAAPGRPL